MSLDYRYIRLESSHGVATLVLDRPETRNSITQEMMGEIRAALDRAEADDEVRAVVLVGAGPCFSSGFDIKEQVADRPEGREAWDRVFANDTETAMRLWTLSKPTIAAVHGACFGGAMQLAVACDITIAEEDAIFGEPELLFGSPIPVMILPWLVAPKIAKEIVLAGLDEIPARRAYEIGLINRLVPKASAAEEARKLARRMAVMDPGLVQKTKRALNLALEGRVMAEALAEAANIAAEIETKGTADKHEFLNIARTKGLKAAFAWRSARFNNGG